MFASTFNSGFALQFESGLQVSVQFHQFAYCERYVGFLEFELRASNLNNNTNSSKDAEIAIFKDGVNQGFVFEDGDTVMGYLNANQVSYLIYMASKAKNLEELQTNSSAIYAELDKLRTKDITEANS